MKVIKPRRIREFAQAYPEARNNLERWLCLTRSAKWSTFQEVKHTFNSADVARVGSGKNVVVFNVCGNKFRLITAIHYNMSKVFVLKFMTHAEYDKDHWKDKL